MTLFQIFEFQANTYTEHVQICTQLQGNPDFSDAK
jgi:hypothetical protein